MVYFPGSTIGNLVPSDARRFLRVMARVAGPGGGLLIGVDLKKDPRILHAAYNDPEGITAGFNLNLLVRINRELGGDFDLARFAHRVVYDRAAGRIEMRLVSLGKQQVRIAALGIAVTFEDGEELLSECSYKYTPADVAEMAAGAGLAVRRSWKDRGARFLSSLLVPA